MYCKKCGNMLDDDASFCAECGDTVTKSVPTNGITPPPEPMPQYNYAPPNYPAQSSNALNKKKGKKKLIIALAVAIPVVVIGVIIAVVLSSKTANSTMGNTTKQVSKNINTVGNTPGNINNGGCVAQLGDWIYYENRSDNDYLYKVRTDGTGETTISKDQVHYINVVGDWIYYENRSDNYYLYKIRTDGTSKTKLSSDEAVSINVVGDWIYYVGCIDGTDNYYIYKIRTDGTGKTKLSSDIASCMNVAGDWIYYTNNSDNGSFYKMHTDGTGKTKLSSDSDIDETNNIDEINIVEINVVGDWVYYVSQTIDSENNYPHSLYKIRTDGTGETKLNGEDTGCINVVGDWIYYVYYIDDSNGGAIGCIYKIRTDGTEKTKLSSDSGIDETQNIEKLNIVGDWIYYYSSSSDGNIENDGSFYKMHTDGTGNQKVN